LGPKRCVFHCYLGKIRTMDKIRNPNISVCYTPSSEPYSIYCHLGFMPCRPGEVYWHVRGTCCLHLRKQSAAACLILWCKRWGQYIHLNCR
jgi:hypothetical protein